MICLVVKWSSQLPPSLLSAQKAPGRRQSSVSQGKLRLSSVTSALRHFHPAFPAHPGTEGLCSQHTLTLYGSPTGNTSLWDTHSKFWGPKHKWAHPVLEDLLSEPGQWLCPSGRAETQPWELSDCWAPALVHLTHLFCHLKSLLTLLLALPERLKNSCSVVFHFPVWDMVGVMLSSTSKGCKGCKWKITFIREYFVY